MQVLGDALRLIHFPAMNVDEFTKIVVPAALLEVDEENAVFRALLGASVDPADARASSESQSSAVSRATLPAFPRNSRNFVTTRCDVSYDGFTRSHGASSSLFRGGAMPHRHGWSLTVYCDHSIKVNDDDRLVVGASTEPANIVVSVSPKYRERTKSKICSA